MNKISIRGTQFFLEDLRSVKKEAILMVHGHPFDHSMWKYQYEALKDYRLIVPDLRGYGKTDYLFNKIFIEEQALDLRLILDHLKIDTVHLIGLSMGGQIIIEFSRLFPSQVKSLVICASSPVAETESSCRERLQLAHRIESIGMRNYASQDIQKYLHPKTIKKKGYEYFHLLEMMESTRVEGAVASHKGRAERRNNLPYLKEITMPTLVIAGEKDYFFPTGELEKVAGAIQNVNFEIVKNAGHLPNMEQPETFNELICNFYRENIDS